MKKSYERTGPGPAVVLAALAWCGAARAAEEERVAPPPSATSADRAETEAGPRPLRAGGIVGVGFPRPLAIEGLVSIGGAVALGAEYGLLPSTSIDGVQTSLWSLAGDARFFPFRGPFFVGLRAGRQHVDAKTTITVAPIGSAPEALSLDSWFINPRLGFLWTSRTGLAFGVEAGVQVPLGATVSSSLPLSLVPSAQKTVDAIGNSVLPTVDLLRVGLLL